MSDSIDLSLRPRLLVEGGEPVEVSPGAEILIGRDPSCGVPLEDELASRRHARVWRRDHECWVEDLGSPSGTFVNEQRLDAPRVLADNDVIRIGAHRLRYAHDEVPCPPPVILGNLDPAVENLVEPSGSEERVRGQVAQLRSMLAIAEGLATLGDPVAVARHVVTEVMRVVRGDRGLILLVESTGELKQLAALLPDGTVDPDAPYSRTILRMVLDQRVALLTEDAPQDGRLRLGPDGKPVRSIQLLKQRSVCCVPLLFRDRVLGILQVSASATKAYGPDDLRLLGAIARLAALAFESARVHHERNQVISDLTQAQMHLRSRVEQFRLLYQLEHQIATTQDLGLFLTSVARQAVSSLGGEAGAIFLVDEDTGRITFAYPVGGMEQEIKHQTFEPGRGFVGHVISTGQPALENDVPASPHFDLRLAQKFGLVARNLLAVPLIIADERGTKVIGALEVLNKDAGPFTPGDQQLLTFLAAQIASALLRMRLQEERTKRERLATIGTMAASIAHDFGTPLQMVSGYIDILEAKEVAPPERVRMLGRMRTYLDRIGHMVTELLEFVRGECTIGASLVSAADFIGDVAAVLEPEVQAGRVRLVTRLDHAGSLRIDPERMRRVIFNLVNNALTAMDADGGGTLTLSCRLAAGGAVELEVADSGPGIPHDIRLRLFTPFVTFGKKGGTGLGLSIAKRIVNAHGGTIEAHDVEPRGTRFVIRLPA